MFSMVCVCRAAASCFHNNMNSLSTPAKNLLIRQSGVRWATSKAGGYVQNITRDQILTIAN
jgi:hypothetical protein